MHRPRLAQQLAGVAEPVGVVTSVLPEYDHDIRFSAVVEWDDGASFDVLLCVGPKHPLFMESDDGSGCVGTWCWWDDVVDGGFAVP